MKILFSILLPLIGALSEVVWSESKKIDGYFVVKGEFLDCSISSRFDHEVIIGDVKERILNAQFFGIDDKAIFSSGQNFTTNLFGQEWTRFHVRSKNGQENGSVYRIFLHNASLPEKRLREDIHYLTFSALVYNLAPDGTVSKGEEVTIRLDRKNVVEDKETPEKAAAKDPENAVK